MEQRLSPIKLDSYQPLREVVCESLREAIRKGVEPAEAYKANVRSYGRFDEAVKKIDPRKE